MAFPYKNPISPIQVLGPQSVDRSVVFGTHFSTNGTGGYMEVFSLSGLTYEIPNGGCNTGNSGNTIPINFVKGTGAVYSPDVLILNSDNISSGRRKLGMLAYVYEEDQVYQYDIPNYEQLWTAATASTNCVVINEFGTTVRNNTTEGQTFINAWTASTIEGVNGIVRANARWKKYWGNNLSVTGGSYNGVTSTLTLVNITGGTVDITGFGPGGGGDQFTGGTFTQSNLEINLTSTAGTLTITGVTGLYISGGSYTSGNTTLTLSNSTGGTLTITGFSQTFSGGSGNCINQLYLNEIYPCTSDIKIQPLSAGKVFFGLSNGASGFTVDLVTDTSFEATRLGLNTNSPQYTFDFYARDRKNRLYFRDNLTGAGLVDIKNIIFSGDPDTNASFSVISTDESGQQGAHGISIGVRGYTTASSILNNGVGKTGDTFITAFADTNGLNIINGPNSGAITEDYIRFYAGQLVNNNTPDIHIQGSGVTRGFVGINKTGVTNQLHVFASSNPVRFEGLQSSANTRYLVADSDGVVTYTTASPGGGGGDSITGGTYNQNNLNLLLVSTASTVTITGVTGLYISGGSYTSGNTTLTLSNSTGGTLTITGFSQTFSGGSGNCINQLYLNEIYPCTSDIKIQPLSAGKVFFGSLSGASGFTIDLVSDTGYTTTRLGLNNSLPDYTIDFYSRDRKNRLYLLDNLTNIYSASNDAAYGPGQPPRMIIVTTPGIDNSLAGTPITVYNSAGDSETRILNGVITPSPSPGFSRLNFAGSLWAEDYRQAAGGYFVFPLSSGIGDSEIKNLIFSGKSDTNSSFSVTGPNRSELQGFHGISIGIRGYTTSGTALNNKVGVTGDSFIQVFPGTNGLNIINEVGTDTDDYIRFYAGRNFIDNTPDIHIQGSGATRGYVGINTTGVTNQLHVSATTNPLRLEGLQESGLTRYLVSDSNGVVYYTTGSTSGSSSGFTTVSINGITQFTSLTSQTINFSGIGISITSGLSSNTIVFSASTSSGNIQQNKIVLRKVDLGSRNVTGNTQPNIPYNLFNVLVRSELWDPLSGKTQQYLGSVLNYYMTVNDNDGNRKKILFSSDTLTNTFNPQNIYNIFSAMTDYKIASFTATPFANFYCELVVNLDSQYSAPTQMKLVNPLFNSFNSRKYSRNSNQVGWYEFITNYQEGYGLYQNFVGNFPIYFSTSTSNDITKNIYDIISNEATFYGPLYGSAQNAMTYPSWDNTGREIIQNSVFVEHLTNFYSTYKIPTNLYKGWNFSQVNQNNFSADIMYDIVGGSTPQIYSYASAPTYGPNSSAFLQLVDTYRILPSGDKFVIYGDAETLRLSGLTYEVYDKQQWKYINGYKRAYKTSLLGRTGIQVLPGYNEIYVLELEVIGTPGGVNAGNFYLSLIDNYFIPNNPSVKSDNPHYQNSNFRSAASFYLSSSVNFNSNPYGPYVIIQSTDEKMQTLSLSANSFNDYGVGEINVKAIYKGHTFRPEIYPLNLSQLILEVPESFFYDGSVLQPSENSSNNIFELSGVDVTNKKLRLVVKYTKLNKWDIVNLNLIHTFKRSLYDNTIFTLTIDDGPNPNSFETLLARAISWNKEKELRPGSVEIYFAFYDINTYKTSLIPNYKIVMINYGDNEIFKLIRGDAEINSVIP